MESQYFPCPINVEHYQNVFEISIGTAEVVFQLGYIITWHQALLGECLVGKSPAKWYGKGHLHVVHMVSFHAHHFRSYTAVTWYLSKACIDTLEWSYITPLLLVLPLLSLTWICFHSMAPFCVILNSAMVGVGFFVLLGFVLFLGWGGLFVFKWTRHFPLLLSKKP